MPALAKASAGRPILRRTTLAVKVGYSEDVLDISKTHGILAHVKRDFLLHCLFLAQVACVVADGSNVAILCGVDVYQRFTPLHGAVADAHRVDEFARFAGFSTASVSTKDGLMGALRKVKTDAGQTTSLLVYFAGHGIQIEGLNYLLFQDSRLDQPETMLNLDTELIPLVKATNAAKAIILLDSCRNEPVASRNAVVSRGIEYGPPAELGTPGAEIFIAYATMPGQASFEKRDGSGGYFTEVVLEGLQSRVFKIGDFMSYMRQKLPERTNEAVGVQQFPSFGGEFDSQSSLLPDNLGVSWSDFQRNNTLFAEWQRTSGIGGALSVSFGVLAGLGVLTTGLCYDQYQSAANTTAASTWRKSTEYSLWSTVASIGISGCGLLVCLVSDNMKNQYSQRRAGR